MESLREIGDLYRKLGFSAARRTQDDLAELFCRFLNSKHRPGSVLGQLLGHARDAERVSERLAAEGIADVQAFFAGRWSTSSEAPGDLLLERFLVRDMDEAEHAEISRSLEGSAEGRELLDRLLKQRLIFLADYPPEPFAARVTELLAARTPASRPHRRRSLRWISIPVAAAAAMALLGMGLFTQARSPANPTAKSKPTRLERAAKPDPKPTEPANEPRAEPRTTVASKPAETTPKPDPPSIRERRNGARLLAYARAGTEVRAIDDGEEVGVDERVVAWVKSTSPGYAALVSVEAERTRIYFAEQGNAVAIPAGGPTRLGRGKPLQGDDVELVLLMAREPFAVAPIVARMRRGATPTSVFDGTVRRLRLRLASTEAAAGSQ